MTDPFVSLTEIADSLWDLYQSTDGKDAEKARSMYDTLENVYLEPFRRKQVQADTQKYVKLTASLKTAIRAINSQIQRINKIADDVQQVAQYAAIFDQIIAVAAKLLLV